jgi:DNA polymerase I
MSPQLDREGNPIGGLTGFMKSLQKNIRETNPDEVVVCWEGQSNSSKRKEVNEDYKGGRKAPRLNREFQMSNPEDERKNRLHQQFRLIEYLEQMPVVQLSLANQEADDIIAWVCRQSPEFQNHQKVIVSSDKDFIQLCNEDTILLRPIAKEVLTVPRVLEKHSIHPNNFALARAMIGDSSDNLPGVKGIGPKTVVSKFPFLIEEQSYSPDDLISFAEQSSGKAYQKILENKETVQNNYAIMQLYDTNISLEGMSELSWAIQNTGDSLNKTTIRTMMIKDGILNVNLEKMFSTMNGWVND